MEKRYHTGTILVNKDATIVSVNSYICHLTNKSETELLTKDINSLFSDKEDSLLHESGELIPVFYEKNRYFISDEEFTLYIIWNEDIELENHPIYKTIINETNDMIVLLDTNHNIQFASKSFKDILLDSRQTPTKDSFLNFVFSDDKKTISKSLSKVVVEKDKKTIEFRLIDNTNSRLTVTSTFNPIIGKNNEVQYIIAIMRDVDLKDKDIKNIVEREQRFKSLFSQNPDFVFSLDLDTCFVDINDTMLEATGFTRNEILDRPFSTLLTPDFFSKTVLSLIEVKNGTKLVYDTAIIKKQGNPIYVSLSLFPISVRNKVVGIHGIAKDISKKREYEKQIYQLAYTDTLTNLPNRAKFQIDVFKKFSNDEQKQKSALIFFDIDNFKNVNDSLGHTAGDTLLKESSNRVKNSLPEHCHLFRMSGDEFTILVEHYNKKNELTEIAKVVLDAFKKPFIVENHEILISSSLGIALFPEHADNVDDLIRYADSAMYFSKQKGKNYFSFFNDSMIQDQSKEFHLNGNLRKAIDNNEFRLHYQPIVNAHTEKIISAEALIRWYSPEQGIISPAVFIPLAEASGMIHSLGNWVIEEVCRQLRDWINRGYKVVPISLNVSGRQFERQDVYRTIQRNIKKYGIDPRLITIEVTETFAMKTKHNVLSVLDKIKELGCGLAIDDFGSGYSSLSYLKDFPVNRLKMDKTFTDSILTDEKMKDIVKIIIELGHILNLEVVAEGVETKEELQILEDIGTDAIQGYYFSKPLDSVNFENNFLTR